MADRAAGSKDLSPSKRDASKVGGPAADATDASKEQPRQGRRRSSTSRGVGKSLADTAAESEASKPAFLITCVNPILEELALM